jgi:hypothetical protein
LPSVNTFLAQPFINYNMAHGWYLTSSPLITANWLAAPGQQWVVPVIDHEWKGTKGTDNHDS